LEHYFFFSLVPLTFVLAWQDWKSRQVNLVMALVTALVFVIYTRYFYQAVFVFSLVWMYRYFRKNSIQLIDITLFSLGAGCIATTLLPIYCLLTAIALVVLFKLSQQQKLPFVVAWALGFWGSYILNLFIYF
jgi:hypothetical protein